MPPATRRCLAEGKAEPGLGAAAATGRVAVTPACESKVRGRACGVGRLGTGGASCSGVGGHATVSGSRAPFAAHDHGPCLPVLFGSHVTVTDSDVCLSVCAHVWCDLVTSSSSAPNNHLQADVSDGRRQTR